MFCVELPVWVQTFLVLWAAFAGYCATILFGFFLGGLWDNSAVLDAENVMLVVLILSVTIVKSVQ